MEEKPHDYIAMVPSPGMGHLIPFVKFATLLASRFNFSIALILPTTVRPAKAQTTLLESLLSSISYTFLSPLDPAHLPHGAGPEVAITLTHTYSLLAVRGALATLACLARVVVLVTDHLGIEYYDVARDMGVKPYMYLMSTAMCLFFLPHLPILDERVSCEYRDMPHLLVLPGCVPLHSKDFVDPVLDHNDDPYRVLLGHVRRYKFAEDIFVNTFSDLEPGAIKALQTEDPDWPPVYPVGPITRSASDSDDGGSDCLNWLDQQPFG